MLRNFIKDILSVFDMRSRLGLEIGKFGFFYLDFSYCLIIIDIFYCNLIY